MHDLTASFRGPHPPLTIHTSVLGDENTTPTDSDNGIVDGDFVSPFSSHSDSIISPQWSSEVASHVPLIESFNVEPSHVDVFEQDALNENFALFDRAPAVDGKILWDHLPDQILGISDCVDDLMGSLPFEEMAEMPEKELTTAVAWPEMQLGTGSDGASPESSALLRQRNPKIPTESSVFRQLEHNDVSISTTCSLPKQTPVLYNDQFKKPSETPPYDDLPELIDGQAVCWLCSPHDIWIEENRNFVSADPGLNQDLGSHPIYSDDDSGHTLSLDKIFQPGLSVTDIEAPFTLKSGPSSPVAQMRVPGNGMGPNDTTMEHQIRRLPNTYHEVRVGTVQASDDATDQKVMPNALSPARARYHGPFPCDKHQRKRRQPFQDLQKRIETGETRKLGACVRCREQRVRVSDNCAMASILL